MIYSVATECQMDVMVFALEVLMEASAAESEH